VTGVARHLGIKLAEYDQRIRTFIPHYRQMLDAVANTVSTARGGSPEIVDLGIGTGGLTRRCLAAMPHATVCGIDADPDILAAAGRRLARYADRLHLRHGNFSRITIPKCDAIIATLALHHIRSIPAKRRFYAACWAALRPGGVLVSGDVFLADDARVAINEMSGWRKHLLRSYSPRKTRSFFSAWSREDRYFPASVELGLLRAAGFDADIVWRRPPFGIMLGRRRGNNTGTAGRRARGAGTAA
jgi:tRNA (cmo5U34)-methyltransferase